MARIDLNSLTRWITAAAVAHPTRLDRELADRTGSSVRTARRALQVMTERQWLVRSGTRRKPRHAPGPMRQVVQRYPLAGLQEDLPWADDFAPYFMLPAAIRRMVQHAFCELLNNAIDHSGGTQVTVSLRQTASHVQLLVSDDGQGLFRCIAENFSIADPQLAMLELCKGKLTSQPQRHSGQGLFFTSRLADVFDLHANDTAFQRREWEGSHWWPRAPLKQSGTSVYASFLLDTPRTLDALRQEHSADGSGFGFDRTVVPMRLIASAATGLESRAQARRIGARLDRFERAELDFSGITEVGHAFADELFRVLPADAALADLVAVNMAPRVQAMVASVTCA